MSLTKHSLLPALLTISSHAQGCPGLRCQWLLGPWSSSSSSPSTSGEPLIFSKSCCCPARTPLDSAHCFSKKSVCSPLAWDAKPPAPQCPPVPPGLRIADRNPSINHRPHSLELAVSPAGPALSTSVLFLQLLLGAARPHPSFQEARLLSPHLLVPLFPSPARS